MMGQYYIYITLRLSQTVAKLTELDIFCNYSSSLFSHLKHLKVGTKPRYTHQTYFLFHKVILILKHR